MNLLSWLNSPYEILNNAMRRSGFINATPEQVILMQKVFDLFRPTSIDSFYSLDVMAALATEYEVYDPTHKCYVLLEGEFCTYNNIAPPWVDFYSFPGPPGTFVFSAGGDDNIVDTTQVPPVIVHHDMTRTVKNLAFFSYTQGFYFGAKLIGFKFTK